MKSFLFALIGLAFLASCGGSSKGNSDSAMGDSAVAIDTTSANYMLLKQQCLICHGGAVSHDKLIAPPMLAVKRRYMMRYNSQEEFEKGMLEWTLNPTKEKALM